MTFVSGFFPRNFSNLPASKFMSSLSDAQFEAELPEPATSIGREADLFRKAQAGDRAAFGQIVILFQDRLYNAILRIVADREEARELTQETFTRALVKIDSFRGEAGPYTWLFRIAVNLAISELRKTQRHRTLSLDQPSSRGGEDQASALVDRVAESRHLDPAGI